MATHSSVLAWRIPGTGEPGGLPSMGVHRVRRLKRLSSSSSSMITSYKLYTFLFYTRRYKKDTETGKSLLIFYNFGMEVSSVRSSGGLGQGSKGSERSEGQRRCIFSSDVEHRNMRLQ